MITRNDIAGRWTSGINEGMNVYASDGEKLGKVTMLADDTFQIEKGFFFPKDFLARYDDIQDIRDDGIYLNSSKDYFTDWRNDNYEGWSQVEGINQGRYDARPLDEYKDRYSDYQSIPLSEERLEAKKVMRESGNVRVRKIVHTDLKHFTVPVLREEVRIERTPVTDDRSAREPGTTAFQDQDINVKVMEEEVEITKRPVVKEEVRVVKDRVEEQREVSGEVRSEDIQVEKDLNRKRKAG